MLGLPFLYLTVHYTLLFDGVAQKQGWDDINGLLAKIYTLEQGKIGSDEKISNNYYKKCLGPRVIMI